MPVSLRLPKRRSKKSDSPKATPKGKAAATPIKPSVDSEEAAAINALIKQADGGRDMAFLRERRMSGEPEDGKNRPRSKSLPGALDLPGMLYEAEVEEVKELLRASAKQDAGQVLRDRRARNSKGDPDEAYPVGDASPRTRRALEGDNTDRGGGAGSLLLRPPAATGSRTSSGDSSHRKNSGDGSHRKNSGDGSHRKRVDFDPNDDISIVAAMEATSKSFDVTQLKGTDNLPGAAARGARAAALERVKQASSAVGGVFLTTEQHNALKEQINLLTTSNKRLNQEIEELRRQVKTPDNDKSPSKSPSSVEATPGVSPFGLRATGGMLSNFAKKHSPFGRRSGNHASPVPHRFGLFTTAKDPITGAAYAQTSSQSYTTAPAFVGNFSSPQIVRVDSRVDSSGKAIW